MTTDTPAPITSASPCPCTSGRAYGECCEPFLTGKTQPPTAEALMRSRYSAYAVNRIDYIEATDDPRSKAKFDRAAAEAWATKSQWTGLEVTAKEACGPQDSDGMVEFTARFRLGGKDQSHRERATFTKIDGRWYFVDGQTPTVKPFVNEAPALGRNDPCHCGSGKKFKKCHGA